MKKKLYTKPQLCTVIIDNEISLVMMTSETDPPNEPEASAQRNVPPTHPTQESNFNDNPFGE